MLDNPYVSSEECEISGTDDCFIDYSSFSDEEKMLVVMLTRNGDVHSYLKTSGDTTPSKFVVNIKEHCQLESPPVTICIGSQAAFVLFGTLDGNLLIVPIQVLLCFAWRGASWTSTSVVQLTSSSVEPCLAIPTCTRCFVSNYPPRTYAVVANKAGFIMLVDLMIRKCVVELRAPETIHKMDLLIDENSIEILVSSFTGRQWIIPLEQNGKGIKEVLTFCHPSDLQQLEPPTSEFMGIDSSTILALDSENATVDMYPTMKSLVHSAKQTFKVPPETWLVHSVDNLLFTVSKEAELRCALHFGITTARFEYTLVRGMPEWRPLGMISAQPYPGKLQTVYVVTERSLVKLEQCQQSSLKLLAAEFIFNLKRLTRSKAVIAKVAEACHADTEEFEKSLIPLLLSARKDRWLDSSQLSEFVELAKVLKINVTELVDSFEKVGMEEQLLSEVVKASKTTQQLREKLVDLFVKKAKRMKQRSNNAPGAVLECDVELSHLLTTFEEIATGELACLSSGLYRSTGLLAARRREKREDTTDGALLKLIATEGRRMWQEASAAEKGNLLTLTCSLSWSRLEETEAARVGSLLATWQRDVTSHALHETCLRTAKVWMGKFPKTCRILYLVTSAYLISDRSLVETSILAAPNCLDAGYNCSVAIDEKEQILVWGDFTNQSERTREAPVRPPKKNDGSSVISASNSMENLHLPKVMSFAGGRPRAVSCGTEHVLLLTASGKVFAWGGNRYGQCGVGHTARLAEFQKLEGPWPPVVKVSAGQFHSAFICTDGSLWTFGWGTYGQLGLGGRSIEDKHTPTKVNGLITEVKDVGCGRVHTVVLTSTGRVLVCGGGSYGQMGVDEDIRKTYAFTPLMLGSLKVKQIATKFYHSACVTEDAQIYEWGRNPQEQKLKMFVMRKLKLAQLKNKKELNPEDMSPGKSPVEEEHRVVKQYLGLPKEIPREDLGLRRVHHSLDGNIVDISCGMSHSALITDTGSLYTWGKGLEHQLGHGNKTNRTEPQKICEPMLTTEWSSVRCGNTHTLASTNDGQVYAWGANGFSQCGFENEKPAGQTPRKLFYQTKDGSRKGSIPLPDELSFVPKPSKIPSLSIQGQTSKEPNSENTTLDEKELITMVRECDSATIQKVAEYLKDDSPPLSVMTAFIHLMAGNVLEAIGLVESLTEDPLVNKSSLQVLSLLIWDVVANHEDVQTREVLMAAFKNVPMPEFLRRGKQVQQLWPTVWDDIGSQSSLSIDEKIAMLDGFASPARPISSVTIPSSHLEVSPRIRVFAHCSHAEPAVVGTPPECAACLDEWTEKVRATLGAP